MVVLKNRFVNMPRIVKLDEIVEGQIIAETLKNKYGQVLINKGTLLSLEAHIRVLKMWGINEINVFENISDANSQQTNENEVLRLESKMIEELKWNIKNENDKFLIDIAVLSKLEGNNDE